MTTCNTNLLASRAMLCTLKTGAWRATKLSKHESAKVNSDHHTKDAAKVTVRLTDHSALVALGKLHAEARTEHYRVTLPCVDDGFRLIPSARELEHSATMRKFADTHETLINDFLADYDSERLSAPVRLNGLYDAAQWPDASKVREKFNFATRYLPVPANGTWQEWLSESAEEGRVELRERIGSAVRALAHKLSDKDSIFRDSLVGNLSELLALAPDLNLADDPEIIALTRDAAFLATHPAETLRDNAATRKEVAERAAALCAAFKL